jgi:hypothetical protein
MLSYYWGYAAGSVLFGFSVAWLGLGLGRLVRLVNPWIAPILVLTFLLVVYGWTVSQPTSTLQDKLIGLALLPGWLWSLGGWGRHRRRLNQPSED